jgi:hypothetical protein
VPAPAVVIEMPATDRAMPIVGAMVDACSRGVAGRCVLSGEPLDVEPTALAVVTWRDEDKRVVRVEVGLRREARAEWRAQAVTFRAEDAPAERWRSVGLVIATLVDESVRASSPPPPPVVPKPTVEPPPPKPAEAAPPRPPPKERIVVDGGALAGPGLDTGVWRFGGWLRGGYVLGRIPLGIIASVRLSERPADAQGVTVAWGSGSIGVAGLLRWRELRGQARIEAATEWTHASVSAGGGDSASRWVSGARLGIDVGWMLAPPLAIIAGFDETILGGSTSVNLRDQLVGRSQALESAALLGARLAF